MSISASSRESKSYTKDELSKILTKDSELNVNRLSLDPLTDSSHLAIVFNTQSDLQCVVNALNILHHKMLQAKSCDALLRINEDKTNPDESGRTMASLAAGNLKNKTLKMIVELLTDDVSKGRQLGANFITRFVNQQNDNPGSKYYGSTPLHFAAESGRVDNVRLLLTHGAIPFVRLPDQRGEFAGWTELDLAVHSYLRHDKQPSIQRLFLEVIDVLFSGSAEHIALCEREAEATVGRLLATRTLPGTVENINNLFANALARAQSAHKPVSISFSASRKRKSSCGEQAASFSLGSGSASHEVDPSSSSDSDYSEKSPSKQRRPKSRKITKNKTERNSGSPESKQQPAAILKTNLAAILTHSQELKNIVFEMPDTPDLSVFKERLKQSIKAIENLASPLSLSQSKPRSSAVAARPALPRHSAPFYANRSHGSKGPLQLLSSAAVLQSLATPILPPPAYEEPAVDNAEPQQDLSSLGQPLPALGSMLSSSQMPAMSADQASGTMFSGFSFHPHSYSHVQPHSHARAPSGYSSYRSTSSPSPLSQAGGLGMFPRFSPALALASHSSLSAQSVSAADGSSDTEMQAIPKVKLERQRSR